MDASDAEKRSWEAPSIVGTCSAMCPSEEVRRRQQYNQIHPLERNPGDAQDTSLLIKAYYRTLDDRTRQPEYLRNREGVAKSMDRLRTLMDRPDVPFETRASYIWDRYRGIWKDMSIQSWQDMFRVTVLEEMARFMIFADFDVTRLSTPEERLSYQDIYDTELGIGLLNQCFVTLSELYEGMREHHQPCPNEFEFRVYQLLLQMTPVEGRELEHGDIMRVYNNIPDVLKVKHGAKMQLLSELFTAIQQNRWDRMTDLIWHMDFFEFALGRRIMRRFRETRFLRYYARLKRNNTQHTTRPMRLETFCDTFFLDVQGGLQFAEVHGLKIIPDANNRPHVVIHEGFKKASDFSPALGCGLPEFAYLTGEVAISDFVIQRPTMAERPQLNFPCRLLMWPSYVWGLQEVKAYHMGYGMTGYHAALVQQDHWHKYIRLAVLNEIPQEAERAPDGSLKQTVELPLPWFRTVIHEQLVQHLEPLRSEQVPVHIPEEAHVEEGPPEAEAQLESPSEETVTIDLEEGEITDNEPPTVPPSAEARDALPVSAPVESDPGMEVMVGAVLFGSGDPMDTSTFEEAKELGGVSREQFEREAPLDDDVMEQDQLSFDPWMRPDEGPSEPAVTSRRAPPRQTKRTEPATAEIEVEPSEITFSPHPVPQLIYRHTFTQGQFNRRFHIGEDLSKMGIPKKSAGTQWNGLDLLDAPRPVSESPRPEPIPYLSPYNHRP